MFQRTINLNDLIGKQFGKLTVVSAQYERSNDLKHNELICTCRCECGNTKDIRYNALAKGTTKSCGCIRGVNDQELIGKRFGKLTVMAVNRKKKTTRTRIYCMCQCECGNIKEIVYDSLKNGETTSCGCIKHINAAKNLQNTKERLYRIWNMMKDRCYNSNNIAYKNYCNINVCDEWKESFNNFFTWAINHGYYSELTLDRINSNGNYEPNNCRWITAKAQNNNKTNNIMITLHNMTKTLAEWSTIYNIEYSIVRKRIVELKWDPGKALTTPVRAIIKNGKNRLYNIWNSMKDRCYNSNNNRYDNYGNKGIIVCDEWKNNFENFKQWALNNGYSDDLSIDRINNDGNYEPNNCRWTTMKVQNNNKTNNLIITINNEIKTLAEWCEYYSINYKIVHLRITKLKWDPEKALTTSIKSHQNNSSINNSQWQKNSYITINSETKTLIQWCEQYNINYDTVHDRIKRSGWDPEKALTTPIQIRKTNTQYANIRKSLYSKWHYLKDKMCDEWKNSFQTFLEWSVNNGYAKKFKLQRIDTNEYSPNNSRWIQ